MTTRDINGGGRSIRRWLASVMFALGVMLMLRATFEGRGAHPNIPAPAQGYVVPQSDDDGGSTYYITREEARFRAKLSVAGIAFVATGWLLLKRHPQDTSTR